MQRMGSGKPSSGGCDPSLTFTSFAGDKPKLTCPEQLSAFAARGRSLRSLPRKVPSGGTRRGRSKTVQPEGFHHGERQTHTHPSGAAQSDRTD
jgi:hypothetical protein